MKLHYDSGRPPGRPACGLRGVPPERVTDDPDQAGCGNCLSSLAWRNAVSQRDYREHYERFHGPGGFSDRAGQTTPASATSAPQARAALERVIGEELRKAAARGRDGAGDDRIAAMVGNAVRTLMTGADSFVRLALEEDRAATAAEREA